MVQHAGTGGAVSGAKWLPTQQRGAHKLHVTPLPLKTELNTLVTIVRSYLCVCQRVRVEISNSSANVVALVEFVSLLLLMQVCRQVKEWLHLCAFSPVCVILCFCNLCACA